MPGEAGKGNLAAESPSGIVSLKTKARAIGKLRACLSVGGGGGTGSSGGGGTSAEVGGWASLGVRQVMRRDSLTDTDALRRQDKVGETAGLRVLHAHAR